MEHARAWRRILAIPPAVVALLCAAAGSTCPSASAVDVGRTAPVVRQVEDPPHRVRDTSGMWAYYIRR